MPNKVKILLSFAGTGITAANVQQIEANNNFSSDTVRIYFNGCQDPLIGGVKTPCLGLIAPNLDVVASNLEHAFSAVDKTISIRRLKQIFGDSIIVEPRSAEEVDEYEVDTLNMRGFSRGAVTTFACARHLNFLQIPMHILAMEPVPGDSRSHATHCSRSEYAKNLDLSSCDMLKSAQIVLGTYVNNHDPIQNTYFRQMIPEFSPEISSNVEISYIPKKYHTEGNRLVSNMEFYFLYKQKIMQTELAYQINESSARLYSIPRVMQQKFHTRTNVVIPALASYKNYLLTELNTVSFIKRSNFLKLKAAEAYLAVHSRHNQGDALNICNSCDNNPLGPAARDFIIEITAIMRLVAENACLEETKTFRKTLTSLGGLIAREEVPDQRLKAQFQNTCDEFLIEADNCLIQHLSNGQRDHASREIFINEIMQKLNLIRNKVPRKSFQLAKATITKYLAEAAILHLGLDQFLNETETIQGVVETVSLSPAADLAHKFYNFSEKQRRFAFKHYRDQIPDILTNAREIASVAQFLSPREIAYMLGNQVNQAKFTTYADLNILMQHLSSKQQRLAALTFIDITKLNGASPKIIAEILQNLSHEEQRAIKRYLPVQQISFQTSFFAKTPSIETDAASYQATEPETNSTSSNEDREKEDGDLPSP